MSGHERGAPAARDQTREQGAGRLGYLLTVWPVTSLADAEALALGLPTDDLHALLEFEHEHSNRPRHRIMLRGLIDHTRRSDDARLDRGADR
jgi:hypothetical protein